MEGITEIDKTAYIDECKEIFDMGDEILNMPMKVKKL